MGKIVKPLLVVAAVAVAFVPGVGQALAPILYSLGVAAGTAVAVTGYITGAIIAAGVSAGFGIASKALGLGPKVPRISPAATDRLNANIVPAAPRKIALGRTALNTDVRDMEFTGADQEYQHLFVVTASHRIHAHDEIWFDDKLAWTSAGGVQGEYVGYLTVATREEGSAGNAINISGRMGSTRRYTGCAYVHFRFKRTGNTKKAESPFASSVPTRMTIIGRAALICDPREGHDPDEQATWAWDDDGARNPALQLLWCLRGWEIEGKLAVGCGMPSDRIDIDSFITAANLCDEPVTRAAGGTQPRYRSDGVFSEADDPGTIISGLCAAMNGVLRDASGKLALQVLHNDLATPVIALQTKDVLAAFSWQQTPPLNDIFNVVRGRYVDPSPASLYQLVDYPEVRIASTDGIERVLTMDAPLVQDAAQVQRLAKQQLQRNQYQGTFTAEFNARGWACQVGDPVTLSFTPLGFVNKKFRVVEQTIQTNGIVPLVLQEENEDIYAWDAEETPAVEAADPTFYDPLNNPFVQAIEEIELTPGPPGDPGAPGAPGASGDAGLSIAVSAPAITIAYDGGGVIKSGQLPRSSQILLFDGSSDATESATYAIVTTDCTATVSNTAGSRGLVTITAIAAPTAAIVVTATLGSRAMVQGITLARVQDGASGASGSRSGAYGTTFQVVLPAGAGCVASAAARYGFTSGSGTLIVQLQYSLSGAASWTTFAASPGEAYGPSEGVRDEAIGGFANGTGALKTYDVRAVSSGSGLGFIDPTESYTSVTP